MDMLLDNTTAERTGKVPAVTLGFWIIKILATTLGQTGGDAVTMSMNLGYLVGTAIFVAIAAWSSRCRSGRASTRELVQALFGVKITLPLNAAAFAMASANPSRP